MAWKQELSCNEHYVLFHICLNPSFSDNYLHVCFTYTRSIVRVSHRRVESSLSSKGPFQCHRKAQVAATLCMLPLSTMILCYCFPGFACWRQGLGPSRGRGWCYARAVRLNTGIIQGCGCAPLRPRRTFCVCFCFWDGVRFCQDYYGVKSTVDIDCF